MNTEEKLKIAGQSLGNIVDPIGAMKRYLEDGYELNGNMSILPSWAIRYATGDYTEVGAQLRTRDGRKLGNAFVISINEDGYIIAMTDIGNVITISTSEAESLFYKPEYVVDVCSAIRERVRI